jgi:DNA-repair protein XRCC1
VRSAGGGKIVKNDWIEECYRKKRRLPWRRFCTDRNDRGADSEEEIYAEGEEEGSSEDEEDNEEEAPTSPAKKRKRIIVESSSSEDDEPVTKSKQPSEEDIYDGDTDVDEDTAEKGIFSSAVFYIDPEWSLMQTDQRKEIVKIITDCKG